MLAGAAPRCSLRQRAGGHVDDILDDGADIADGFGGASVDNAYFIGNANLNALNMSKAFMCLGLRYASQLLTHLRVTGSSLRGKPISRSRRDLKPSQTSSGFGSASTVGSAGFG